MATLAHQPSNIDGDIKAIGNVVHQEHEHDHDGAIKEKVEMALGHEDLEKTLTLWQNVKLYKKVHPTPRPTCL